MNKHRYIHGLEIRWAIVPFNKKPHSVKKRPVVILQHNKDKSRILRITTKFFNKKVPFQMSEFKIGKFHQFRTNGLLRTSFVDLARTQTIPNSLLRSHVGYLSLHSTSELLRAGYKFQKKQVQKDISKYQKHFLDDIPKWKFKTRSHPNRNFHTRNPTPLTKKQRVKSIKRTSNTISRVKALNGLSR